MSNVEDRSRCVSCFAPATHLDVRRDWAMCERCATRDSAADAAAALTALRALTAAVDLARLEGLSREEILFAVGTRLADDFTPEEGPEPATPAWAHGSLDSDPRYVPLIGEDWR